MEVNKPVFLIQQHRCAQANKMMTMNVIRYMSTLIIQVILLLLQSIQSTCGSG